MRNHCNYGASFVHNKKMFDRAVTTLHLTVCLFVWLFVFMFVSEHWFQLNAIYNSNIRYFWSDELVKLAAPSRTSQGGLRHSSVHSACSYRAELVFVRCCCRAHRVCVGATFFYVKSRTLKLFSFEWNFSVHFDRERKKPLLCFACCCRLFRNGNFAVKNLLILSISISLDTKCFYF